MMKRVHRSSRPVAARRRVQRKDNEPDWAWAEQNRGKPSRRSPPKIARAATRLAKSLHSSLNPSMREIEPYWSEIVGADLAKLTQPVKFTSQADGIILRIKARGPAAMLIEAQSAKIIERVQRFSGKTVKRLKIVQASLQADFIPKRVLKSRIIKVQSLDERPKNLDALLDNWAQMIARNSKG